MKMIPRIPNNPILALPFIVKIIAKLIKYFLKIKIICSRGEIRTLVTCMKNMGPRPTRRHDHKDIYPLYDKSKSNVKQTNKIQFYERNLASESSRLEMQGIDVKHNKAKMFRRGFWNRTRISEEC